MGTTYVKKSVNTHSHQSNTSEQDIVDITPISDIVGGEIFIDMNNITQITTIRLYIEVDGTNDRLLDIATYPSDFPSGVKVVEMDLPSAPSGHNIRVTIQSGTAEGATRSVPYFYTYEEGG